MANILCRVVWADEYRSSKEKFFAGNMKYPAKHKTAVETLNFFNDGGYLYGFVEHNQSRININVLGAGEKDDYIDGVTVIWCALDEVTRRLRIVGWYNSARVYRKAQVQKHGRRGELPFQFWVKADDACLLPPSERDLEVPMKPNRAAKGFFGQRNWFFPDGNSNYVRFLEAFHVLRFASGANAKQERADLEHYQEGQRAKAEITLTIRNPKLVAATKKKYGFDCQVCGFNFERTYGDVGKEFIEAHHLAPIHTWNEARTISVAEMRVLCANCHRMVHKTTPPLTIEELKRRLR